MDPDRNKYNGSGSAKSKSNGSERVWNSACDIPHLLTTPLATLGGKWTNLARSGGDLLYYVVRGIFPLGLNKQHHWHIHTFLNYNFVATCHRGSSIQREMSEGHTILHIYFGPEGSSPSQFSKIFSPLNNKGNYSFDHFLLFIPRSLFFFPDSCLKISCTLPNRVTLFEMDMGTASLVEYFCGPTQKISKWSEHAELSYRYHI